MPTPRFVALTPAEWSADPASCRRRGLGLGLPLFVKPARLGSSVGITKVGDGAALDGAVAAALAWDDLVIVEEGIPGREIEVAVLGTSFHNSRLFSSAFSRSICSALRPISSMP